MAEKVKRKGEVTRFKYGGATWTFTYPHVVPDLLGPKEYVEDEKEGK